MSTSNFNMIALEYLHHCSQKFQNQLLDNNEEVINSLKFYYFENLFEEWKSQLLYRYF